MPINNKLLEILVCPVTKLPVFMLSNDALSQLNQSISQGKVQTLDGNLINEPGQESLVTSNKNMIYRIENDIPIMLEDQAIAADLIENI